MPNIESFKRAILLELKERGEGEVIPLSEWYNVILPNYAEAEQELFLKAVSALQKEGKVECYSGVINPGISLR